MCGIAGLVALGDGIELEAALLDRMTDSLAHRGPDGRGVWRGEGAGLGHRRLAIIDPEGGAQPWGSAEQGAVLVYNGELYNHLELRTELEQAGIRFRSRCDTEVLYHALLHWGTEQALDRFRGMYAFALWEIGPRRLTLARDPLGVKPLYWAMRGGLLRFGSEIKAILADGSFPRGPHPAALVNYLAHYRLNFQGQTLFKHIQEIPPGHFTVWEGRRRSEKRYWRLPSLRESDKHDPGLETVRREFTEHLARAVDRRLMADVPLGAYLSGGIDSSVLVTLMKGLGKSDLQTFAIGFAEAGGNEFEYSRLVATSLGVEHHEVTLTEEGYFRNLDPLIAIKDTPLSVPNEVALRFLSKHLKKRITVVLSGEGADELLAGYQGLMDSPHDQLLARSILQGYFEGDAGQRERITGLLRSLYGSLETAADPMQQFLRLYQWIPRDQRQSLLAEPLRALNVEQQIDHFWAELWAELDGWGLDPYEKVLHVLEELHLSALLLRLDATTMAEGVEGRVPYTDRDLVEYVARLPIHYKTRWASEQAQLQSKVTGGIEGAGKLRVGKALLRDAFVGAIPEQVRTRPKSAFPVPLDTWLYGSRQEWAKERILTEKMNQLFDRKAMEDIVLGRGRQEGMKIWMLANVGTWLETYFQS